MLAVENPPTGTVIGKALGRLEDEEVGVVRGSGDDEVK